MLDKLLSVPLMSQRAATFAIPLAFAASYVAFAGYYFSHYTTQPVQANMLHNPKGDGKDTEGLYRGFREIDNPLYHGLAPFSVRNIKIKAKDGSYIHGWHILPHSYYKRLAGKQARTQPFSDEEYDRALAERPTLLYLHGANWSIAAYHRTRVYSLMTARLDINLIVIDYRGYGLSPGFISEQGAYDDAQSTWSWLCAKLIDAKPGVKPEKMIGIWGHSLGGIIATELANHLQAEGVQPRCLCVNGSPANIRRVTEDHPEWAITLPYLQTLKWLGLYGKAIKSLKEEYNLETKLAKGLIRCPILITNSTEEELLSIDHFNAISAAARLNRDASKEVASFLPSIKCTITRIPADEEQGLGELITWSGKAGLHGDYVGTEAVVDMVGEIMHLD